MKKTLTLLLVSAALIPSISYAYRVTDVCAENVHIDGISTNPSHGKNSWKISYSTGGIHAGPRFSIMAKRDGSIGIDTAEGRAIFTMALNAMNSKQPVKIINLRSDRHNLNQQCSDFNMLVIGKPK